LRNLKAIQVGTSQKLMRTMQKVEHLPFKAATRQKCGAESLQNRRWNSKSTKTYCYFSACLRLRVPAGGLAVRIAG